MKKLLYIIFLLFGIALTSCYNDEIEQINSRLDAIENTTIASINEKIATINEKINQINEQISVLEESDETTLRGQIDSLKEQLNSAKQDITEAYQNAIALAILTNNGEIDEKIAAEIEAVNEKISTLEERINSIESRLGAVEDAIEQIKALDIQFNVSGCITFDAGTDVFVEYTIVGGDDQTIVEAWGDGGWSAKVIAESSISGQIKVTPADTPKGKVVVLATSGAGGVSMKSLYFVEGILEGVEDTYVVEWWATTLNIKLKTSLEYTVNIPAEAQSWLSVAETRAAVRNETLTFSVAENPEEMPSRSASIDLLDRVGDIITSFTIVQKLQPSEDIIEFADKYAKKQCVSLFDTNGDGELSHIEASKVTSLPANLFGNYSEAVKSFDEMKYFTGITSIGDDAFRGCSSLTSITIPEGVTSIGDGAFRGCSSLTSITIPEGVTSIGRSAFSMCKSLTEIYIPYSLVEFDNIAFDHVDSMEKVHITSLDRWNNIFFDGFGSSPMHNGGDLYINGELITKYVFPKDTEIVGYQIGGAKSVTEIIIPETAVSIIGHAFHRNYGITKITIPQNIRCIDRGAFIECTNLKEVYCEATIPPQVTTGMFSNCAEDLKIYVPSESVEEYKIVNGWRDYADSIVGYDFE